MKLNPAIAFVGLALFLSPGLLCGEDKSSGLSKADVERIVREYILQHPEVIMESVRAHQERERIAAEQRSREALRTKRRELFDEASSPVAGKADGSVAIVQFFDYNCGYCRRVTPTLVKLLEQGNVQVIFKELPILGPDSHLAARAALAAHKQGAYVRFHRALMDLKSPTTADAIEETGRKLGLDIARLKADMDSAEIRTILGQNQRLASAIGVQSTPSFVIGNELVAGAMDQPGFEALIVKAAEEKAAAQTAPANP